MPPASPAAPTAASRSPERPFGSWLAPPRLWPASQSAWNLSRDRTVGAVQGYRWPRAGRTKAGPYCSLFLAVFSPSRYDLRDSQKSPDSGGAGQRQGRRCAGDLGEPDGALTMAAPSATAHLALPRALQENSKFAWSQLPGGVQRSSEQPRSPPRPRGPTQRDGPSPDPRAGLLSSQGPVGAGRWHFPNSPQS